MNPFKKGQLVWFKDHTVKGLFQVIKVLDYEVKLKVYFTGKYWGKADYKSLELVKEV